MTTAPQDNRGGYRPTAPQNNTGVSGTGGAGSKDGQPNRYMSGGGQYGASKALNQQQQGAPMEKAPVVSPDNAGAFAQMPQLGTLLDPTNNPAEPITAGSDFGPGVGSEAMPKNISANTRPEENQAIIAQYLPDLIQAASYKDAPDSFKRFVNYLASK
jgi:hypothetical protein